MVDTNGTGAAEVASGTGGANETNGAAVAASGGSNGAQNGGAAVNGNNGADTSASRARSAADILSSGSQDEIRDLIRQHESGAGLEETGGEDEVEAGEGAAGEGTGEMDGEAGDEGAERGEDSAEAGDDAGDGQTDPEDQPGDSLPKRIRVGKFQGPDQVTLVAAGDWIAKNPGKSLEEALAAVGWRAKAAGEKSAAETGEKRQETAATEPSLETQIAEKEAAYHKALADFDNETALTLSKELRKLERQVAAKEAVEGIKAEQRQTAHEAKVEETVKGIAQVVPEFCKEGSPLHEAANAICDQLDPKFFENPQWPRTVLAMAWMQVNPDKQMPVLAQTQQRAANPAAAKAAGKAVVPTTGVRKAATAPAVLRTGNGTRDDGGAVAKAFQPGSTKDDVRKAIRELEAQG